MTPPAPRPRAEPVRILLVEDNQADADLTAEVLGEVGLPHVLHVARDGEEALARLRGEGSHAGAPLPHLVLLDLNLPLMPGREVLQALKADPRLRRIPVVVLTTSTSDEDVARCYDLQANSYMVKPVVLADFVASMEAFRDYWLNAARLPPG